MKTVKILQDIYLDYFNNYLSVEKFANDNNLTTNEAQDLIKLGREVHERLALEYKQQKKVSIE